MASTAPGMSGVNPLSAPITIADRRQSRYPRAPHPAGLKMFGYRSTSDILSFKMLTATIGWRAVYWVNVPVGLAAIVAGRYLLPRTREFSRPERFDWPETLLLVAWTSAGTGRTTQGGGPVRWLQLRAT
jgi:hypothetical protein